MRVIEDYKFVPLQGGGVCLIGKLNNVEWVTTRINAAHSDRVVRTQSGSQYQLGTPHASVWGIALQLKRPKEFEVLSDKGCI